jgi:hypothetical protein
MQSLLASQYVEGNHEQAYMLLYSVLQVTTLFSIVVDETFFYGMLLVKLILSVSSKYKLMVHLVCCRLEV